VAIDAIKDAFPSDRGGKIEVEYHSYFPNLALSVANSGVGMPSDAANAKHRLGTTIVKRLPSS